MKKVLETFAVCMGALFIGAWLMKDVHASERALVIVVGAPAGGATDIVARLLQRSLEKELERPVVIKNVAGAAGTIGASEAARAPADGNTLLLPPIGPVVFLPFIRDTPYSNESFEPICRVTDAPLVMMTSDNSGIRSMKDAVTAAKANPGGLPFASTGDGTLPFLSQLAWEKQAGVKVLHVPFKGSADVVVALKSGTVALYNGEPSMVAQNEMQPIAVFAEERQPRFPSTPTAKELGYDLRFSIWLGLYAPKDTPSDLRNGFERACRTSLEDEGVQKKLEQLGSPASFLGQENFGELNKRDAIRMRKVIKEAGLQLIR